MTLNDVFKNIEQNQPSHLNRLQEFLKQPSVAPESIGLKECSDLLQKYLNEIGFTDVTPIDVGAVNGEAPEIFGKIESGANRTMVIYNMYDTGPAGNEADWNNPPFGAEIIDISGQGKAVVARGADVRKGPLIAFLNAVESIIRTDGALPVNLRFVAEGEEVLGSPNFPSFVKDNNELFKGADSVFWPMAAISKDGNTEIKLGAKGMLGFELECSSKSWGRGPMGSPSHSADKAIIDSPMFRIVQAISSMTDISGNVAQIKGFYDNVQPPTDEELQIIDELLKTYDVGTLKKSLNVDCFIDDLSGKDALIKYLFSPVFQLGSIIGAKTSVLPSIPLSASAIIHCRVIPNMTTGEVFDKVRLHLDSKGFNDISVKPLYQVPWMKTSSQDPAVQSLIKTYDSVGVTPQIWPKQPRTPPPAVFGLPYVDGGFGKGGNRGAPNEYLIVDGTDGTPGLVEFEKFFASYLYNYASQ